VKHFKRSALLLAVIVVAVFISSCNDDKDDNPVSSSGDELVGTWVLTKIIIPSYGNAEMTPEQAGITATFILRTDRTFTVTTTDSTGTEVETGTWSAANGKVSLKGDTETVEMPYTLTGNKLTVETVYTFEPFGEVNVKLELTKQ